MKHFEVISKIDNMIYLSGLDVILNNPNFLLMEGIKNILVCIDKDTIELIYPKYEYLFSELNILFIPMYDNTSQNLWKKNKGSIFTNSTTPSIYLGKSYIEIAYNFIENAVSRNEKVLVHCYAGMSRSASILVYYFMKKNGIDYYSSKKYIKSKRPIIEPNDFFAQQLKEYDIFRDTYHKLKLR